MGYDLQNIIESIYDRTMPNIFTKVEVLNIYNNYVIFITF